MDAESMDPGAGELNRLMDALRQAGEEPDRTLLDRVKAPGQSAERPLIEMAIDEKLLDADSDSAEVSAPLHAVQLLGELGTSEAVEPLLSLLERSDDDGLSEVLPEAFGGIGAPALQPLRALLFDRTKDVWARVGAAESLSLIGQRHPMTRSDVVSALVDRLDPAESQTPEDEILDGQVISVLLDLKAVEAAPAIRRAFAEDRVDSLIVGIEDVLEKLGLPYESASPRPARQRGLHLRLRCTACQYEREHLVETICYDLPTHERHDKGEPTPYNEFIVPQRITCPKCGAVDQYELSNLAHTALLAEMLKPLVAYKAGGPAAVPEEGPVRLVRFRLKDGREMHPLAAREMYRQQVEVQPNRPDLRVQFASVLRFLGYREEATEQYREALHLEPSNLEALLNLGRLAQDARDLPEAERMFRGVLAQAPSSRLPRDTRDEYVAAASEELAALTRGTERSGPLVAMLAKPAGEGNWGTGAAAATQPVRVRKVGRNDPCPCGSGKKYKKCHGR